MSKEYISPHKLSEQTGVDYRTILNWCANSVSGRGRSNPLKGVKREANGYYRVKRENIGRVLEHVRSRVRDDGNCE